MSLDLQLIFPPFCLDTRTQCLWRGEEVIPLRRKTLAVLRYLVEHHGQVVTKEELFTAVWPGTRVSEVGQAVCVRELRRALADDFRRPQFIKTVPRRGYQFIAPVTAAAQPVRNLQSSVVGRTAELARLREWLEKALHGERQVVFVTGEPGIGKTTLVDAFLAQLEAEGLGLGVGGKQGLVSSSQFPVPALWIGRGQCIEHYGSGEAYLPVLEALGRLCRAPDGERIITLLSQHAPTWLLQMPSLLSERELEAVQRHGVGATQERMLREFAEAVELLAAERPLVLVLEDLHWSDVSTLDLLAFLARRREGAQLLMIGTYRPVEILGPEHPLRAVTQELHLHHYCAELRLGFLTEAEIAEYLIRRFPAHQFPDTLARIVWQRTEGNPLFMVNVVDFLVAQGLLVEDAGQWKVQGELRQAEGGVPDNIRQMIERQIERLSAEEQRVLEVASVAGGEFTAAAVAAGLEVDVRDIEERCAGLARHNQFLRAPSISEWPDGTVTACYGFIHALYQEVLYERVTTGWRQSLHRRIGERIETAYGGQVRKIAAELAVHFERGRDYTRAIRYLEQAGENAARRSAYVEARTHLTKGLTLLTTLPDTPERAQQEFTLQIALGGALTATQGYGAPEVEQSYMRARELVQHAGDAPQLFPALRGLWVFALVRAEHGTAQELGEQLLRLSQRGSDPALLLEAHQALGMPLGMLGEFAAAQVHLEQGIGLHDLSPHHTSAFLYAHDPGVACLVITAWTLWFRGYPDQALARAEKTLSVARKLSHPFNLGLALVCSAVVLRQCHRQEQAMQRWADEAVTLLTEQRFPYWLAMATMLQGSGAVSREQSEAGITQLKQGLAAFRSTEAACLLPYFLALLAEAYGERGQAAQGLLIVEEALATVDKTGERFYEAELWRLKGTLMLQSKAHSR